jgi:protein ImuB
VLGHERGASTRVEVGLLAPQRDAASLFELARTRLERIELAAAVHALTLCADDLPPLCPLHQDLFEPHSHRQADWPALAERLRARLGDAALSGLRCVADHRPARAWEFAPALIDATTRSRGISGSRDVVVRPAGRKSIAAVAAPTPAKAGLARRADKRDIPLAQDANPRPFWLLRRPIPLRGIPPRVLAGPERIESGWWDGHDQRRDYYLVETRSGQRAWAFVEAGSPVGTGTAQWTLHGWFA